MMEFLKCSDICSINYVLNTVLVLVDETENIMLVLHLIRMFLIIDKLVKFIYFSLLFNKLYC